MFKRFIFIFIISAAIFSCSSKYENAKELMKSPDVKEKIDVLEKIRTDKYCNFEKILEIGFIDKDPQIVWRSIDIAGSTMDEIYIERIINFLSHKNPIISFCAKDIIIKYGSVAENKLLLSFKKSDYKTKKLILKCLEKIGTSKTVFFNFEKYDDNTERKIKRTLQIISERLLIKDTKKLISDLVILEIGKTKKLPIR